MEYFYTKCIFYFHAVKDLNTSSICDFVKRPVILREFCRHLLLHHTADARTVKISALKARMLQISLPKDNHRSLCVVCFRGMLKGGTARSSGIKAVRHPDAL